MRPSRVSEGEEGIATCTRAAERAAQTRTHNGRRRVVSSEMYAILINVGELCVCRHRPGDYGRASARTFRQVGRIGIGTFSFEMRFFLVGW